MNSKSCAVVLTLLILAGCQQSTGGSADVSTNSSAQTKADAALAAARTTLDNVYSINGTSTPLTGLSVTGTSSLSGSAYTFDETATVQDYDPNETGIMATGDFVLKGTLIPGGAGKYTFTGDVFLSGTVANGHVLFTLSLTTDGTTVTYSGTATVSGVTYNYSGQKSP